MDKQQQLASFKTAMVANILERFWKFQLVATSNFTDIQSDS